MHNFRKVYELLHSPPDLEYEHARSIFMSHDAENLISVFKKFSLVGSKSVCLTRAEEAIRNKNMEIYQEITSFHSNRKLRDESMLFMTRESFLEAAPDIFGHSNNFFFEGLFAYLSEDQKYTKVQPSLFFKKMQNFLVINRDRINKIVYFLYTRMSMFLKDELEIGGKPNPHNTNLFGNKENPIAPFFDHQRNEHVNIVDLITLRNVTSEGSQFGTEVREVLNGYYEE
jgi:hypothetical protein